MNQYESDPEYYISHIPTRQQLAQHYHSSINQPNLENVQAKLSATRQKNHQLALKYFRQKYGSTERYQQFASSYIESGVSEPQGFKERLDREGDHIRRKEMEKIRRKALGVPEHITIEDQSQAAYHEAHGLFGETNQDKIKKHKSRKDNPWLQEKNIQQKRTAQTFKNNKPNLKDNIKSKQALRQEDREKSSQQSSTEHKQFQFVDHIMHDINKKKEFVSEFEQYLQQKNSVKQREQLAEGLLQARVSNTSGFARSGSLSRDNFAKEQRQSMSPNNRKQPPAKFARNSKSQPTHQQQLVRKIFKDLSGEVQPNPGFSVSKLQLTEYLVRNKRIIKVLGLSEQTLSEQLLRSYNTKNADNISYKELVLFVLKVVGKQKQRRVLEESWRETILPKGCMLTEEQIAFIQSVFKQMDKHSDLIVPRIELISRLAVQTTIKKLLNSPAVYQPQLERSISLRRVFQRIELQCILGGEEQQKAKEYISWQQFIAYFQSGHQQTSKYNLITLLQSLKNQEKLGLNDIPEAITQLINRAFQKLLRQGGQNSYVNGQYFETHHLTQAIRDDPQYQNQKYTMVRCVSSPQTNLPMQTLEEVLHRIQQTGYKYINTKEFLEYFSTRGKPIELLEIQQSLLMKKTFGSFKVKHVQEAVKMQEQARRNQDENGGYDSDPQLYSSTLFRKKQNTRNLESPRNRVSISPKKPRRPPNQLKNQTAHSLYMSKIENQVKSSKMGGPIGVHSKEYKITVPQPFKFQERERQRQQRRLDRKLNRSASTLNDRSSKQIFHAREIPKKVLQVGLFQKMIEDDHRRQQQRKRNSMLMTLANENPFSFQNRDSNSRLKPHRKNKDEREEFVFKAKPIPWYCSVDLLQKKKEAEIYRNQKIAKKAQENLAKAKLPPRMEKDFQQKIAKKILQDQRNNNKSQTETHHFRAKQPPNFVKLHKEFEEQLQRKRKENKTTLIHQFNFSQIKPKDKNIDIQKEIAAQMLINTHNYFPKHQEPQIAAVSTVKFTQQAQKRRKQIEQKRKKDMDKILEEEKRQQVDQGLREKINKITVIKKYKQQQQLEKRRQQLKNQQKAYQQHKKGIIDKARKQPLLVERPLKRDQKIQKMKKLYMISQTLKKNGIKGKQHDAYFNKQERVLLQDWEMLKDRL